MEDWKNFTVINEYDYLNESFVAVDWIKMDWINWIIIKYKKETSQKLFSRIRLQHKRRQNSADIYHWINANDKWYRITASVQYWKNNSFEAVITLRWAMGRSHWFARAILAHIHIKIAETAVRNSEIIMINETSILQRYVCSPLHYARFILLKCELSACLQSWIAQRSKGHFSATLLAYLHSLCAYPHAFLSSLFEKANRKVNACI